MLLTSTTLFFFLFISVASLGIGIFAKRQEMYLLGIVLLFFMGLMTVQLGIAEPTGKIQNATMIGNQSHTVETETYEISSGAWTNGIGLLFIMIAAGLSLHFYKADKDEKQRQADSIEIEE